MIAREQSESEVCNGLELVYPLITYEEEYRIAKLFRQFDKKIKADIEVVRKRIVDKAKKEKVRPDFNVKRDVYYKILPEEKAVP
mmetsp:Transcript_34641/g.52996  ORF Transcript_34641/g.52996 Transcript_34641/m.52996 type:complete len:84 (+) Transcript_34641:1465-1716(+)